MRGSFYSRNWRGTFVYAAMFLFALTLNLRAQVTTSAISGMVKDNNGTPLPGVNIIAVHEPSGTKAGAYSRSDGRFNLPGMRVGGPYTVTASMIGYKEHKIENINLALGEEKNLTFVLVEEAVEMEGSEIVAERNPIINDARTGAATTVNELQVKYLPAVTRDFNDFTKYTPQFSGNSAAGRNNRYNNISIDGAVSNDLFGLAASGTPGGQAGTAPISLDAIQEFQVQIAPYDVRLG
ncbi:MAG TPA: carboxypeptidase-like regulatory domain-containing protein, partial [bacterium]|nr:carboxypeptidase-like regulatory domain-containing protein [bacterium]